RRITSRNNVKINTAIAADDRAFDAPVPPITQPHPLVWGGLVPISTTPGQRLRSNVHARDWKSQTACAAGHARAPRIWLNRKSGCQVFPLSADLRTAKPSM